MLRGTGKSTDTIYQYGSWFKAQKFLPYTFDFEKTGYVIFNFETANQIISKLEPNNKNRIEILKLAYEKAQELNLFENLN
ncbi:NUDIX domain-containing protein OS=Ureibacillus acetophenoni OX=614649 GN=SAMN05877842_110137 PE=4 SV=1 [Ureibacillus acetophenoni]